MSPLLRLIGEAGGGAAIGAPNRPPLTYTELVAQAHRVGATLRAAGVAPAHRVAVVLPNGPALASAFACIAPWCAVAPLNPALKAGELNTHLEGLDAAAVVLASGTPAVVRQVAAHRGLASIELIEGDAAGAFTLDAPHGQTPAAAPAGADAVALVLHTSGTTARPKMVPLTQANLCASARHIAATLRLGPEDVCLNVMPLFHVHGLMAPVLASLASGATVHCAPGFDALRFFGWLEAARATWYSAVPTMHQAILARAPRQRARPAHARLRFIRSSSAPLPAKVMEELEAVFGAPVIEAYAMTEAAHQMCSNPLPPAPRKAGFVGPAAGPDVAVFDADGTALPAGAEGEIVVRGANVMSGYIDNPAATREAFHGDWLRTGDQGFMDADGYVKVTGRLKELVNRGGEKIAPLEVDHALLAHPAVAEACAFAAPHPRLGEDVAAMVVLKDGARVDERALQAFVGRRLARFKVPRQIIFAAELPKGATGKVQRTGLAAALGLLR